MVTVGYRGGPGGGIGAVVLTGGSVLGTGLLIKKYQNKTPMITSTTAIIATAVLVLTSPPFPLVIRSPPPF
jgi:hypothetical protein